MRIRRLTRPEVERPGVADAVRRDIATLLRECGTFTAEEITVALEVIDDALAEPGKDYHLLVATPGLGDEPDRVLSYVCFGRTPMTETTWDLYWIATHPDARGRGLASRLVRAMEAELPSACGGKSCTVRIETSQLESYGAARGFYERSGYAEVGRIADFYKPGDDLVIFAKRVLPVFEAAHDPSVVIEAAQGVA